MNRRWLPGLFVVGAVLLVAFETTPTLFLGVVLLLAAIVVGWRLIAEPGFLEGDAPEPPADDGTPAAAPAEPE